MDSWASASNLSELVRHIPGCRVLALLEVTTGILLSASDEGALPAQLFGLAAAASSELYATEPSDETGREEPTEIVVRAEEGIHILAKLGSVYGLVMLATCDRDVNVSSSLNALRDVVTRIEFGFDAVRRTLPPTPLIRESGFRSLAGDEDEVKARTRH